jgi:hypothetical protein
MPLTPRFPLSQSVPSWCRNPPGFSNFHWVKSRPLVLALRCSLSMLPPAPCPLVCCPAVSVIIMWPPEPVLLGTSGVMIPFLQVGRMKCISAPQILVLSLFPLDASTMGSAASLLGASTYAGMSWLESFTCGRWHQAQTQHWPPSKLLSSLLGVHSVCSAILGDISRYLAQSPALSSPLQDIILLTALPCQESDLHTQANNVCCMTEWTLVLDGRVEAWRCGVGNVTTSFPAISHRAETRRQNVWVHSKQTGRPLPVVSGPGLSGSRGA